MDLGGLESTPIALAFCDGDFTFLDKDYRPLKKGTWTQAAFVHICWRTQKNKNNGETKLFATTKDQRLCPVESPPLCKVQFVSM